MSKTLNVGELFKNAAGDGTVSREALHVLSTVDLGAQIQAGLGITADYVTATEVVLLNVLIDDSSSIRMVAGNTEAIRQGYNDYLDALVGAKKRDDVLVLMEMLNQGLINPYSLLAQAVRLDTHNYNPAGGTPLFERSVPFLGTVLAKTLEFEQNGVHARTLSLIITDGGDNSHRSKASDVEKVVRDMLKQENHIIFGMGIEDGFTDFRAVFHSMGIPDSCIRTPGNTPKEIRSDLRLWSQSAVRASQNAQAFSKVGAGGFGS